MGDSAAQRLGVIAEPEVSSITLSDQDKYLVLATDGLFDALSLEEITACLSKCVHVDEMAGELMKTGLEGLNLKQIDDNVTSIVIQLPFDGSL